MSKKNIMISISLLLSLLVCVLLLYNQEPRTDFNTAIPQVFYSTECDVLRIGVLDADEFDLNTNGVYGRIHAKIGVLAVPEAKEEVIKLLNKCSKPRAKLLKKREDGIWDVILYITPDGENEISLSKWLEDKNLIWQ